MRGFAGFLVLSAGLGFGLYTYEPGLFQGLALPSTWLGAEPRISLAEAARPDGALAATPSDPNRARVFSPQSPLFAPVITVDARPTRVADAGPVVQGPVTQVPAAAGPTTGAAAAPVANPGAVVTVAETPAQPVTRPVADWAATVTDLAKSKGGIGRGSSKPTDPEARADLVRDIQSQLKRVGCYDGEVDGSWGPGSKRAMTAFTERINATLPIDEPDYILLTLVQGHRTAACGVSCPAGQSLSEGRCVPHAVVAGAARKSRGAAAVVATAEPAQPDKPAPDKAVAAHAPAKPAVAAKSTPAKPEAANQPEPVAQPSSSPATVPASSAVRTVAEAIADERTSPRPSDDAAKRAWVTETKPAASAPKAPAKPQAPAVVVAKAEPQEPPRAAVEPLPGRMTVGGPVPPRIKADEPVTSSLSPADDDDGSRPETPSLGTTRKPSPAVAAPKPVHAPSPRVVHTPPSHARPSPPPKPRYTAPAPSSNSGGSSAAARQRALVYNLFQRPDRF